MSGRALGNRFGWLSEEEDQRAEEARQKEPPAPLSGSPAPEPIDLRSGPPHGLPGVGGPRAHDGRGPHQEGRPQTRGPGAG